MRTGRSCPGRAQRQAMKPLVLVPLAVLAVACGATPAGSALTDAASPEVQTVEAAHDVATEPAAPPSDAPTPFEVSQGTDARDVGAAAETSNAADAVIPTPDATPAADAGPLPSPQPVGFPGGSAARTESKSFVGADFQQTIGFQVYLPPGYVDGTTRYPTVYDLHGLTGSQLRGSPVGGSVARSGDEGADRARHRVFPDGLTESYYADGKDGKKPSETRVVRELIPYIDATYRTVAHRQLRAVTGFSMGGYGAMELATKFPDMFRAGVAYDAALDSGRRSSSDARTSRRRSSATTRRTSTSIRPGPTPRRTPPCCPLRRRCGSCRARCTRCSTPRFATRWRPSPCRSSTSRRPARTTTAAAGRPGREELDVHRSRLRTTLTQARMRAMSSWQPGILAPPRPRGAS